MIQSIYLISTRWSSLLGGGLGVGASFGSTLDVLAHISLSRPLACQVGGGTGVERLYTKKCRNEMRRDSSTFKDAHIKMHIICKILFYFAYMTAMCQSLNEMCQPQKNEDKKRQLQTGCTEVVQRQYDDSLSTTSIVAQVPLFIYFRTLPCQKGHTTSLTRQEKN